jgi:hypothetical protein
MRAFKKEKFKEQLTFSATLPQSLYEFRFPVCLQGSINVNVFLVALIKTKQLNI